MRTLITVTIPVALALGATACGRQAENAANTTVNRTEDVAGAAGNAASNAMEDVREAVTPVPSGQDFADRAARSDAFEIAASKLAVERANANDVKSFAREMITAHTASTRTIKAAAGKASPAITPQAALTDDQQDKLADLGKLRGADFDKAYIDGQVDAHEDALSLMRDYAKEGDVPSLRDAAGQIAPIVEKHLGMARTLKR